MDHSLSIHGFGNQVLSGIWEASPLVELKKQEDIFRAGQNTTWTVLSQLGQVSMTLSTIDKLAQMHLPISPPSTFFRLCCYATPFFSGLLWAQNDYLPFGIRQIVFLFHTYTGTLCQITGVVCSVAYCTLGKPVLGMTSLIIYSVEVLKTKHLISKDFQNYYQKTLFIAVNAARVLLGKWHHAALALFLVITDRSLVTRNVEEENKTRETILSRNPMGIGLKDIQDKELSVNREHVVMYEIENPVDVEASLKDLLVMFEQIPLEEEQYNSIILNKLSEDDDWKGALKRNTDLDPIEYVKTGMKQFVDYLEHRSIPTDAPISYEVLIADTLTIAHLLKIKPIDEQASWLFDLAIASYYCSTGPVREVSQIRRMLLNNTEGLSLQAKVFSILADLRERCFQQSFSFILSQVPALSKFYERTGYFRLSAVHTYGVLSNLCSQLGLPSQEIAKQDNLATVDEISKILAPFFLKPYIYLFWSYYSKEEIIQTIQFAIDGQYSERHYKRVNRQIEPILMGDWLKDMQRANKICSDLAEIYEENGTLKTPYIELLLVNLGALEVEGLLPNSQNNTCNEQENEHKTSRDKKQLQRFALIKCLAILGRSHKS